jgi:hypothetical protein
LGDVNFWAWAVQVLLALFFGFSGYVKLAWPIERLAAMWGWVKEFRPGTVRFIGAAEILGALGMILPMATGILPWLTPLAALGFLVIQVLAIGVHGRRGETAKTLPLNLVALALSIGVLTVRWPL